MTEILISNTLSGKKEIFTPLKPNSVKMYVCGVTVYDYCHIGHGRAYVVFDTIRRTFQHFKYNVRYVQNFTDIDDKIIKRSLEEKCEYQELTNKFINAYFDQMDELNILRADKYPKATDSIPDIIEFVKGLINKGVAYEWNGDVYFEVKRFYHYGKLSKKNIDDLIAGKRIEINEQKKNPLDFVLWKKAKEHEPSWDSPWGKGRPGWHIECSAMLKKELGDTVDIHGGGEDLMFPHHENEICQSESLNQKPLANYWIHNGFVNIQDEKMSKSLGNFVTIKDILKNYSGNEIRFYLLRTHYRNNFNFSTQGLTEAKTSLERLLNTIENCNNEEAKDNAEMIKLFQDFEQALADDFNFPEAIGYIFDMSKQANIIGAGADLIKKALAILGITTKQEKQEVSNDVQQLIDEREEARKARDFKTADKIRDYLSNELGIQLEDTPNGIRWTQK